MWVAVHLDRGVYSALKPVDVLQRHCALDGVCRIGQRSHMHAINYNIVVFIFVRKWSIQNIQNLPPYENFLLYGILHGFELITQNGA